MTLPVFCKAKDIRRQAKNHFCPKGKTEILWISAGGS